MNEKVKRDFIPQDIIDAAVEHVYEQVSSSTRYYFEGNKFY